MSRKRPIYGNCKVLSPDGELMFRCAQKRIDWYVTRDLAELVHDDPPTAQLTFQPNGPGMIGQPFYLEQKENICVVCGSDANLTRHHCVPYKYRKYFPSHLKKCSSHDICPLCMTCHHNYEREADKLKVRLGEQYNCPVNVPRDIDHLLLKTLGAVKALIRHRDKMPPQRIAQLEDRVADHLGHKPTQDDLDSLSNLPRNTAFLDIGKYKPPGQALVEQLKTDTDILDFMKIWRQHFISITQPKFLSKSWDVDYVPRIAQGNLP